MKREKIFAKVKKSVSCLAKEKPKSDEKSALAKLNTTFFDEDSLTVTFFINGDESTVEVTDDIVTLLDYLRQNGKTDTKKMCEEGGCGVCTIIEIVNIDREGLLIYYNNCVFFR